MDVNIFILQLAIIFLPGLIWARFDANFAMKRKPSHIEFFLKALQFGIITYALTYGLYALLGWEFKFVSDKTISDESIFNHDYLLVIFIAVLISVILSVLWIYANTYKFFVRFLQFIKATKVYGDEDVWDHTFNLSVANVEYVHFRDFSKGLTYAGWVASFSETGKLRELLLKDVIVYNFKGEKQYEVPMLYVSKSPEDVFIEFPYCKNEKEEK